MLRILVVANAHKNPFTAIAGLTPAMALYKAAIDYVMLMLEVSAFTRRMNSVAVAVARDAKFDVIGQGFPASAIKVGSLLSISVPLGKICLTEFTGHCT